MVYERFTERARQIVVLAQDEARGLKHNYIGSEHLLLGMIREEEGLAARVLSLFGVSLDDARAFVAKTVGEGDVATAGPGLRVRGRRLREGEGVAARYLFVKRGLDSDALRGEVERMLSGRRSRGGRWNRGDVDLGQFWAKANGVWQVVAIADAPTVTLRDVETGSQHTYVINSPLFAEFDRLDRHDPESRAT